MKLFALLFLSLHCLTSPAFGAHRLVFLGDSLTAGYGLEPELAWPALLQKTAQARSLNWEFINAGISGDTSSGGLSRLDWILKSRPDAVFVCLGANDGLRGVDPRQTEKNLNTIFEKLRQSGTPSALAGMRLPTNYGKDYEDRFAAVFARVARRHQVPLLPFLLKDVGGLPQYNLPDGVHPNEQGQQKVASTVSDFLFPLLLQWSNLAPRGGNDQTKILRLRSDFEGLTP